MKNMFSIDKLLWYAGMGLAMISHVVSEISTQRRIDESVDRHFKNQENKTEE